MTGAAENIFVMVNLAPDLDPSAKLIIGLSDEVLAEAGPTGVIEVDLRQSGLSLILTIARGETLEAVAERAKGMVGQIAVPPSAVN